MTNADDAKPLTVTERKRLHSPDQPVGRWIRPEKRLAIYLRDGFRCLLCDRDLHGAAPRDVTLDHVICRTDGGSNEASNLYTCCLSCNSARSSRPLGKYVGAPGMKRIRRHLARDLKRFVVMAKALVSETASWGDALAAAPRASGEE